MGAWMFVQPNLEWVLIKIDADASVRVTLVVHLGRDRHRIDEQAYVGAENPARRSSGVTIKAWEGRDDDRDQGAGARRVGNRGDHRPVVQEEGEAVKADEPVVELETDKVTVEVPAPAAGVLQKIAVQPGETVNVGAVLGAIADGAAASTAAAAEVPKPVAAPQPSQSPREKPRASAAAAPPLSPAVRKIAEERRIDVSSLAGTGRTAGSPRATCSMSPTGPPRSRRRLNRPLRARRSRRRRRPPPCVSFAPRRRPPTRPARSASG